MLNETDYNYLLTEIVDVRNELVCIRGELLSILGEAKRIRSELSLLKWLLGVNTSLVAAIVFKLLIS